MGLGPINASPFLAVLRAAPLASSVPQGLANSFTSIAAVGSALPFLLVGALFFLAVLVSSRVFCSEPCGPMAFCTGQVFLPPYSKLSVYGFEVLPSQPFTAALLTIASYYFARKRCHRRWFQARTDAFRSS